MKTTNPAPVLRLEAIPWDGLQQSRHQPVSDLSTSRLLLLQLPLPRVHLQLFFLLLTLLFPVGTIFLARMMMVDILYLVFWSSMFELLCVKIAKM